MTINNSNTDLCFTSAVDIAEKIRTGDLSPVTVVDAYFDRIETHNEELNAYITLIEAEARETAREKEREVEDGGNLGALHGVPVAIKDLGTLKEGVRTTFGSNLITDWVPDRTSVLVDRLENAGAIVLGKTNTPEFGHKGTTDNLVVGATGTPFDPEKTAGGSSGGSAAAVAAGLTALAQGSDAGGSIRIPASACGVYGFRPTFGRIPHDPRPNAFGRETLHVSNGPLTRTVEDAALMLDVMVGPHPDDPVCLPETGIDFRDAVGQSIVDFNVAYSPALDVFPVDPQVSSVVEEAIQVFDRLTASVDTVDIEHGLTLDEMVETIKTVFSVDLLSEIASVERDFDVDIRNADPEVVTTSLNDYLSVAENYSMLDYKHTGRARTSFFDGVQDIFEAYDLLLTPTLAVPPFEKALDRPPEMEDERKITPEWMMTWPFNWIGHPVASIPAGFTEDNLPIGMQLIGSRYADDDVIAASAAYERARPWQDAYPPGQV